MCSAGHILRFGTIQALRLRNHNQFSWTLNISSKEYNIFGQGIFAAHAMNALFTASINRRYHLVPIQTRWHAFKPNPLLLIRTLLPSAMPPARSKYLTSPRPELMATTFYHHDHSWMQYNICTLPARDAFSRISLHDQAWWWAYAGQGWSGASDIIMNVVTSLKGIPRLHLREHLHVNSTALRQTTFASFYKRRKSTLGLQRVTMKFEHPLTLVILGLQHKSLSWDQTSAVNLPLSRWTASSWHIAG